MKTASKPKTIRFDALVKSAGEPEQVTLWTKPEDDADFMKAVRGNRVVTVIQRNVGTKKDFGVVGLLVQKNAVYLIFPKQIAAPAETKVIGIKYDRIGTAEPKGEVYKPKRKAPGIPMREKPRYTLEETNDNERPAKATKPVSKPADRKPKVYSFTATATLSAVQSIDISVEATSAAAAAKAIRAQAAELQLDLAQAKITRKVSTPKKQKTASR